jgi:hypothetical protein
MAFHHSLFSAGACCPEFVFDEELLGTTGSAAQPQKISAESKSRVISLRITVYLHVYIIYCCRKKTKAGRITAVLSYTILACFNEQIVVDR